MILKIIIVVSIVCNSFSFYTLASVEEYTWNKDVEIFYKLYPTPKSWSDASQICRNEGGLIAMPSNQDEMDTIQSIVIDYFKSNQTYASMPTYIHMGFHKRFIEGELITESGKSIQFMYDEFAPGEPNSNSEICGSALLEIGKLNDIHCDVPNSFVCQKELTVNSISNDDKYSVEMSFVPHKACPFKSANNYPWMTGKPTDWGYKTCYNLKQNEKMNDFKPKKFTKVYKVHLTPTTWFSARTICDAEGGHLAIIENVAEQELVVNMFNDPKNQVAYSSNNLAWLGFHNLFNFKDSVTVIGTPLKYHQDQVTGSSNYCGGMNNEGVLQNLTCSMKYRFICEKEVPVDTVC